MVNSIGGNTTSFSSSIAVGDGCGGNVVDRPAVTNKDRPTQPKNGRERSVSPSSADTTPLLLRETGFAAARTTADGGVLRRFSIDDEHRDAMTATATAATTTTTTSGTDLERARGVYCSLPLEKVQWDAFFVIVDFCVWVWMRECVSFARKGKMVAFAYCFVSLAANVTNV